MNIDGIVFEIFMFVSFNIFKLIANIKIPPIPDISFNNSCVNRCCTDDAIRTINPSYISTNIEENATPIPIDVVSIIDAIESIIDFDMSMLGSLFIPSCIAPIIPIDPTQNNIVANIIASPNFLSFEFFNIKFLK